jgi:lipid-A-disaccharide synthase-like uncharacterized protein
MEELILQLNEILKRFSPYILGGVIGSVVHRLRNHMSIKEFLASTIISVFVALSVGIICKDYFLIKQETVIFVLCGMSGSFSKILLDELEQILSSISEIFKDRFKKEVI